MPQIINLNINSKNSWFCSYCLHESKSINDFLVRNKWGLSHSSYQCPGCLAIMRTKTFRSIITIKEYSKWVYHITKSERKFKTKKLKWIKIKQKLKEYQGLRTFWDEYFRIKDEDVKQFFEKLHDDLI